MTQSDLIPFLLGEAATCVTSKRYNHAFTLISKAFLLAPENTAAFSTLATLCQLLRRWSDLEHFCRIRLLRCPNDSDALYNLAGSALSQQRFIAAISLLHETISNHPLHLNAWIDLGCSYKKIGDIEEATHCFKRVTALNPNQTIAHDNLLFSMLFSDKYSREELFEAHRTWGLRFERSGNAPLPPLSSGRIRIGYLSPDFRKHSVTSFLEPLLASHDRSRFEIYCYHSHTDEDAVTVRLQSYANQWRNIAETDDNAAAALIRSDGIHILVELAGHTAWNRLPMLSLRPAPVQVTWLGYPHSTGMRSVDYRITDAVADPPDISEQLHTEQLIRLPETFLCFQQPEGAVPLSALPCQKNGFITFGSFNNFAKTSTATIRCWRKIMALLPDARLLLKSEIFADQEACTLIAERLELPLNRLIMIGTTPDRTAHLALYGQVDIALDTFPYNGTTTTCEALFMGVPVISLLGDHHASRVGGSLLRAVGVEDLVANTLDEYVDKAIGVSRDIPRLAWLRAHLPELISTSPLMDQKSFATAMETAYQKMYQRFIGG